MSEKLIQTSELEILIEGKTFEQRISYNVYDKNGNAILIQSRRINDRHFKLRQLLHEDNIRDEIKSTNLENRVDQQAFEKEWNSKWPYTSGIHGPWSQALIRLLWRNSKEHQ